MLLIDPQHQVIILSLVRNNKEGNVGFVKIANRMTVALSRARQALYIMGSRRMLTETEQCRKVWLPVFQELDQMGNAVGHQLFLKCQHPGSFPLLANVGSGERFRASGRRKGLPEAAGCGGHSWGQ